jgi:hypothetical protein
MKNISLISRKWLQGGVALFALYVAMQAGGIVVRLGLLTVATVCSALWWKSKQALDAAKQPISVQKQAVEEIIVLPPFEMPAEPSVHFVKSPVRRPKPVYIHRGGFHLHPH